MQWVKSTGTTIGIHTVQTLCKGTRVFVPAALHGHAVLDKLVKKSTAEEQG